MVIEDGQRRDGVVCEGCGGMFAISGDAARVRWNAREPYTGEPLTYALQNFRVRVLPGGSPNGDIDDDGRASLRTMVSHAPTFTLTKFSQWLAASDLDLNVALNLDGGA